MTDTLTKAAEAVYNAPKPFALHIRAIGKAKAAANAILNGVDKHYVTIKP